MEHPDGNLMLHFKLAWALPVALLVLFPAVARAEAVKPGDPSPRTMPRRCRISSAPATHPGAARDADPYRAEQQARMAAALQERATEKYPSQVALGARRRHSIATSPGLPFPLLDPNDPQMATKRCGTSVSARSIPMMPTCASRIASYAPKSTGTPSAISPSVTSPSTTTSDASRCLRCRPIRTPRRAECATVRLLSVLEPS